MLIISQDQLQVATVKAAAVQTHEVLANPQQETPIIVSFAPGVLKLNGVKMTSDIDFVTRLDALLPKRHDKSVILTAAPDLAHGKVVRLMDIVKRHRPTHLVLSKWYPTPHPT